VRFHDELLVLEDLSGNVKAREGICNLAHIGGVIARHPESVLGLTDRRSRKVGAIFWPFGYTAREEQGVIVLVDPHGTVVAREGDRVAMAGGLNVEGETEACGGVSIVAGEE